MPFLEENQVFKLGDLRQLPDNPADEGEDLEFFRDLIPAGFRRENTFFGETVSKAIGFITTGQGMSFEPDAPGVPDFNPFDELDEKYQPFANAFIDVNSPTAKMEVERRIDQEIEDNQNLAAGGFLGFAAGMAGGLFDPLILLPVGGVAARIATRGGGLLKSGAAAGYAGFTGATATELILQSEQETRTVGESVVNIAAGTILAGALGSAISSLSGRQYAQMIEDAEMMLGPQEGVVAGGRGDVRVTLDDAQADRVDGSERVIGKLKFAFGSDKLVNRIASTPGLRVLVRSRSNNAANTQLAIADMPFYLKEHKFGETAGPSVESDIRSHTAGLGQATESTNELYVRMRGGKAGGGRLARNRVEMADRLRRRNVDDPTDMTYGEFKAEVSRALRRGDTHPIAEVQEAAEVWRKQVFDPLKDRAIELGMLPEDVTPETALTYLTRVYRKEKIRQFRGRDFGDPRGSGLEARAKFWLRDRHPEMSESQLTDVSDSIVSRILGIEAGRIDYGAPQRGVSGPLKSRTFLIDDQRIEDFLEQDIELIGNHYVRTMAPDVELTARFGSTEMAEQIKAINDDYLALIKQTDSGAEKSKLAARAEQDVNDIESQRDILRGTYAKTDPDSGFTRVNKGIRRWNLLRLGGGFLISSMPDIGSLVFAHGYKRVFRDAVIPMVRNFQNFKLSARETKLAGTAWDMVLDTRALSMADLGDEFGRTTKFERGLDSASRSFSLINGLSPWNAAIKQFTGVVTQARILDAAAALERGTISAKELENLARGGISKQNARIIAKQFAQHGTTTDGVKLANTQAWTSAAARRAFRAALAKEVDTIIVTPGVGDKPLWMSTEMGRTIGQFKSFAMSATQRVLITRLQQRDMAVLNGAALSVGLGMMVYAQKTLQAGKPLSTDMNVWVREGVDRSGITGFLFDINNMLESSTRNTIGINALTGGPTASRYASRNAVGALMGPGLGLARTVLKATGAIATGDFVESDTNSLVRLVPYQNLFYWDNLVDKAKEAINDEFNIPRTSQ